MALETSILFNTVRQLGSVDTTLSCATFKEEYENINNGMCQTVMYVDNLTCAHTRLIFQGRTGPAVARTDALQCAHVYTLGADRQSVVLVQSQVSRVRALHTHIV
jgi:hypothetical protein